MTTSERLYNLLPAIYRIRDVEKGEPLRALMSILEAEFDRIERDIDAAYRNGFIETCDDWAIPYIADLLGVTPLRPIEGALVHSLRAYVANTIRFRRRKGTAAVLEQLAWDVAGWRACVSESFRRLDTNQHMNHLRPEALGTLDVRDPNALELLYGPFERATQTVETRRASDGGRYRVPTVVLSLWRLRYYRIEHAEARAVLEDSDGPFGFTFSPLGLDLQLFNAHPRDEVEITHIAEEVNLPAPLRRWPLFNELEALRQAEVDDRAYEHEPTYFGEKPPFAIYIDDDTDPIPPEKIVIRDLSEAHFVRPPAELSYRPTDNPHCVNDSGCPEGKTIQAAVDPVLGRIAFSTAAGVQAATKIQVAYAYGFSADTGGGPYERAVTPDDGKTVILVKKDGTGDHESLADALDTMNGSDAVIRILDSGLYEEEDFDVTLSDAQSVTIEAANESRPCIRLRTTNDSPSDPPAACAISGPAEPESADLKLSGLLIDGQLVLSGNVNLMIEDCTLSPRRALVNGEPSDDVVTSIHAPDATVSPAVEIADSITGPIQLPAEGGPLAIRNSIVDGFRGDAIEAADTVLERSTVFGRTKVRSIEASECIFDQSVVATRTQVGCVRFSHVGESIQDMDPVSKTPRRYRCQPDLALERKAHLRGKDSPSDLDDKVRDLVKARAAPIFTSREYGKAAYAQLARICPREIKTGAEDGGEMGAFCHLQQPHRESNLNTALQEYLPFGLEIELDPIT